MSEPTSRIVLVVLGLAVAACPPVSGPPDAGGTTETPFLLTLARAGDGKGAVISSPEGIDCGAHCAELFASGTSVTLTATPGTATRFLGWTGGGCSGSAPTCTLTVRAAVTVRAVFAQEYSLVVAVVGSGRVTSVPAGIDCAGDCSAPFTRGAVVRLVATPSAGSTFVGWSNGCAASVPCTVVLSAAAMVTATFALEQFPLRVMSAGENRGSITSSPAGIECGARCRASFAPGTSVTLSASPEPGSLFAGFTGGGCTGTAPCITTVSAGAEVVASFEFAAYPVAVTVTGPGAGLVTSSPPGIDCGADCAEDFFFGSSVVLVAVPAPGSLFSGWAGDCAGAEACTLTRLSAAATATATFTHEVYRLTVSSAGAGAGRVASLPAGIDCGGSCVAGFDSGTAITLSATAAPGSLFTGWTGGACSGNGPCTVTPTSDSTVEATFALVTHPVTVARAGNGGGTVASAPAGVTCTTDCSGRFLEGAVVVLTATPANGSAFTGWSGGGCSGTTSCTVTVTGPLTITATFASLAFAYTKTIIPAACQDMRTGAAVPGAVGDDTTSPVTAFPAGFAFKYFDAPMVAFSASSNGFAQVWPTSTGNPSNAYSTTPLPSPNAPPNAMAILWADLIGFGTATVTTLTTGSAPNRRLTLEWANFAFYPSSRTERLTFQVQLVETSSLIEFHYCTLAANSGSATAVTGGIFTVGLQGPSGSVGLLHSQNTAGAVSTTDALRFTP